MSEVLTKGMLDRLEQLAAKKRRTVRRGWATRAAAMRREGRLAQDPRYVQVSCDECSTAFWRLQDHTFKKLCRCCYGLLQHAEGR